VYVKQPRNKEMSKPNLKATFELHNTILINADEVDKFETFCADKKLKPIHVMILYNRAYTLNDFPENAGVDTLDVSSDVYRRVILYQTSMYLPTTFDLAKKKLGSITDDLTKAGFKVIREKIEALRSSVDETVLRKDFPNAYYETRIVVDCERYDAQILARLEELNATINVDLVGEYVPLSVNIKKTDKTQIFITSRRYVRDTPDVNSIKDLVEKYMDMIGKEFAVVKTINETVVYDSNMHVDSQTR
jgi:hypothetical protein